MYKKYTDSYLMTMNKKALIRQLRIVESNYQTCNKMLEQQYNNTLEMLKMERNKAIEDFVERLKAEKTVLYNCTDIEFDDPIKCVWWENVEEIAERLKKK